MFIEKQVLENQGPMMYLAYVAGEPPIIEHEPLTETESPGPYLITAKIKSTLLLTTPIALYQTSFKLFYNTTGIAPFDSVLLHPTGNVNEYSANIPPIPSVTRIYYFITAADQQGRMGKSPKGVPIATFSFSIGPDFVPPIIEHYPYEYASLYANGFAISVAVTDNIGVLSVKLIHRKNGGVLDTLEMVLTLNPDEFQAIIIPRYLNVNNSYGYQILATESWNGKDQPVNEVASGVYVY